MTSSTLSMAFDRSNDRSGLDEFLIAGFVIPKSHES